MGSLRLSTLVLSLALVILTLLLVYTYSIGQKRVSEPETLPTQLLELPDLGILNSTPMRSVDVGTIRDQAVFYTSRGFYRSPPASVEVFKPEFNLAGTMRLLDGKRMAFLKRSSDRSSRTVHVGDDLDGWIVRAIEADRVVIEHSGQHAEILDSNSVSHSSGLIRQMNTPRIVRSGIRVLGGGGAVARLQPAPLPELIPQPRTFHPPQAGK